MHHPPLTGLLIATLLLLAPRSSQAEEFDDGWTPDDLRPYSKTYQGMFTELGARYGLANVSSYGSGDSISAHGRFAFPMSVGDLRLSYTLDRLTARDAATPRIPSSVQRHSVNMALALHPLYIFMLGSDWLSYAIGGIYIDLGAGPQLSITPDTSDPGLLWHYGAGIDIPLWSPDWIGHAPWLNLSYRRARADIDLSQNSLDLHTHTVSIGLAWRFNRLPF